jgi:hypothetical protein
MFIVGARVEHGPDPAAPHRADAAALRDGVLATASAADRLQHVYVDVAEGDKGADLVLFLSQPSLRAAESVARRLVLACLRDGPGTADWTLTRCGATLPGALGSVLLLGEGRRLPRQRPDTEDC